LSVKQFFKSRTGILLLFGGAVLAAFYFSLSFPLFRNPYSLVLTDRQGQLLQARIADDGQWRFPYDPNVPVKFREAITTYEDHRFYHHPGFDPLAMGRAAIQNIRKRQIVSGGSTLTMQTVRLSRNKSRNIFQKAIEIVLALRLECSYTKDEILALYSSHAPFGGNVVGLDAASWRYYGRSPGTLSWGEAACLAVLPNSPALIHPGRNRRQLREKRDRLLDKLFATGKIDAGTCRLAKAEPLPEKPLPLPQEAPHLLGRVATDGSAMADGQAVIVKTTVDLKLQQQVNAIIMRHHEQLKGNQVNNAAALVMEIETGNVLAYTGNVYLPGEQDIDSHVDVIIAPRSPGSTLKPLLYAAMLQDGQILPNSLLPDIPTQISGYAPQNFDLGFDGAVPANRAIARSLNIPAVKMLQSYRTERFHALLKQLGCTTLKQPSRHYGLSLILGGGENSLWELAGIYSSLARSLNHYSVYSSRYYPKDLHMPNYLAGQKTGKPGPEEQLPASAVLGAGAIYYAFQSMEELMRPGDEMLWTQFNSSQKIAWKTGTSFGFRDGWAIGLTSRHLVAVWVGNADGEGRPGLTGISTAAPILFDIFKMLPAAPWFEPPYDDLVQLEVCRHSGYRATELCSARDSMLVPKSGIRAGSCPYHQTVHLDAAGRFRVSSECEDPNAMQHVSWFVLPPALEYYYKQKNAEYMELPPYKQGCGSQLSTPAMEMIYPRRSNKIYVPVELSGKTGKAVFEMAHRKPGTSVYWHLDETYIGTTRNFHQMALDPPPGKHLLVITDEFGERIEQPFEILGR
jgi:penicillin-binding protein 1C